MAMISDIKLLFGEWIDTAAAAIDIMAGRYKRRRQVQLRESEDGALIARLIPGRNDPALPDASFHLSRTGSEPALTDEWKAALRGSRLEIWLAPGHVMLRPLDFPKQANDFLDGMLRSQIDRLTPWTANDAIFGWSPPIVAANERIELTLAATSKHEIQPFLQLAAGLGAASVAVFAEASVDGHAAIPIKLIDRPLQGAVGRAVDVPRLLRIGLLSSGLLAAASLVGAAYIGGVLDSEQQQVLRRISERRATLRLDPNAAGASGLGLLAKRKQSTPSSVLVLEAISRVLPDNTYVTELRIEGDKIQVVGMTQDAPSLVRLIEQSPQFTRATFFAPTTRAQNDPGERFHIEAHIAAYFGSGS